MQRTAAGGHDRLGHVEDGAEGAQRRKVGLHGRVGHLCASTIRPDDSHGAVVGR
jgi:hypothetical protein